MIMTFANAAGKSPTQRVHWIYFNTLKVPRWIQKTSYRSQIPWITNNKPLIHQVLCGLVFTLIHNRSGVHFLLKFRVEACAHVWF